MFDIGWQELFLIAVVALIVIGPKDMPAAMRTVARALSKVRGLSREFQQGVSEIMREAELDEIRRKVDQAGRVDVKSEVGRILDPDGRLRSDFDLTSDLRPAFADTEPGAGPSAAKDGEASAPLPVAMAPRPAEIPPVAAPASEADESAPRPAPPSPSPSSSEPPPGSGKA